jgi:hypothetical protein
MVQPITGRNHDDHIVLSSSSLGDQTTPLSSSNLGDQKSIQTTPSLNLGGRPTGTTISAVFDRKQCIRQAKNFAAQRLEHLRLLHRVKEKLSNGSYKACCNEAIEKYGLEAGDVNTVMLKSRFRRNNIISRGIGPDSPMERVDKLILAAILQRSAMRQPLNVTECIQFSNSLVDKSVIQKEIVEWKI